MKKFNIETTPTGVVLIHHNLPPKLTIRVVVNDDDADWYDVENDLYDIFNFKGNTFVLVIIKSENNIEELDPITDEGDFRDYSYYRNLIKKAFFYYKSQIYINKRETTPTEELTETDTFLLQKSAKPNHWLCTHKPLQIVCKWEVHRFNDTQQFTALSEEETQHLNVSDLARAVNKMGAWLRKYHYNKIF